MITYNRTIRFACQVGQVETSGADSTLKNYESIFRRGR